jgi:hypothetical protein
VLGHGTVAVGVETTAGWVCKVISGSGLRPPVASSVDPNGTPTRPTVDREAMPGDQTDAFGLDDVVAVVQLPDADPEMPAPSNSGVGADVPNDVPVAGDIPLIAVLVPDIEPDAVAVIDPASEEHAVADVIAPDVVGLAVAGLMPGVASSVAPSGIPVAPTAAAGPIPSGDVTANDGVVPVPRPTCANATPNSNSDQIIAASKMPFMVLSR